MHKVVRWTHTKYSVEQCFAFRKTVTEISPTYVNHQNEMSLTTECKGRIRCIHCRGFCFHSLHHWQLHKPISILSFFDNREIHWS